MLKSLFGTSYTKQQLNEFRILLKSAVFSGLPHKDLALLLEQAHLRHYKKNEVVYFRNDPAQAMYLIREGEVEFVLDFDASTEVLAVLGRGMSFGENALFSKSKRTFTAVITSETAQLYMFPELNVRDVLDQHPPLKARIFENLLKQTYAFQGRLFDIYRQSHGFFELRTIFRP